MDLGLFFCKLGVFTCMENERGSFFFLLFILLLFFLFFLFLAYITRSNISCHFYIYTYIYICVGRRCHTVVARQSFLLLDVAWGLAMVGTLRSAYDQRAQAGGWFRDVSEHVCQEAVLSTEGTGTRYPHYIYMYMYIRDVYVLLCVWKRTYLVLLLFIMTTVIFIL